MTTWNSDLLGSIKDGTKKGDYDRTFDNTIRLRDEFLVQHSATGIHNGISAWKYDAFVAGPVAASNILTVAKATFASGLWLLKIGLRNGANAFFGDLAVTDRMPALDIYCWRPAGIILHYFGFTSDSTPPAANQYFRIYISGTDLKVDFTDTTAGSDVFLSYTQLSNTSV